MHAKEYPDDPIHIYQSSHPLIPGAVYWYGEDYLSFAGALDNTLQKIKAFPLKNTLRIDVHLNNTPISASTIEEWKTFYCTEKTQEFESEYILMKRQGYKFLWRCLILLWLCLTGAYVFDLLNVLGDYPQMLGRETFFLLAWVFLWKPIEMVVFEPWSLKHQLRLIEKLKLTKINITTV